MNEYEPMETAPQDGTRLDVLCYSMVEGAEVVVKEVFFAHAPMDKSKKILWGSKNFLSPYLRPIGWKVHSKETQPVLFSINEAVKRGITRFRKPNWALLDDHLRIDIIDGNMGPWLHFHSLLNKDVNGRDQVDLMCILFNLDEAVYEEYKERAK